MQGKEVRETVLARHDGLAVNHCRTNVQAHERLGDTWHAISPVVAAPGVDAHLAVVDEAHGPVAVVLDLMQPARPRGRLTHQRRHAGRDPGRGLIEQTGLARIGWAHDGAASYLVRFGVGAAFDDAHRLAASNTSAAISASPCCLPFPRRTSVDPPSDANMRRRPPLPGDLSAT